MVCKKRKGSKDRAASQYRRNTGKPLRAKEREEAKRLDELHPRQIKEKSS